MTTVTQIERCRCTRCRTVLNALYGVGHDHVASPGDLAVCPSCGHIMGIDGGGGLRDLTDAEQRDAWLDPEIIAELRRIRRAGKRQRLVAS